jgi:class II lanthipeptide synthase
LLSPDRLARIAVGSLSLSERRAAGGYSEGPIDQETAETKLGEWRNAACEGNDALFRERLAQEGWDTTSALRLLGSSPAPSNFQPPEWCAVLNQIIEATPRLREAATSPDVSKNIPYLKPDEPVPFEELLLPFVEVAFALDVERGMSKLPIAVLNTLARDLLRRLAEIIARVLAVEFRAFLAFGQLAGNGDAGVEPAADARAQYRRFVLQIYEEGWASLFEEYCVMARLAATALLQWVDRAREFESRLFGDLPQLEEMFNRRQPLGNVVVVEPGLSDPHDGGRTVIFVEFSSGLKIVYKPRRLGLEAAYFNFAASINDFGALLPLRVLAILNKGDYGWVEFVEHRSCVGQEEIERYYRRFGNFICLVYALNGTDFHYENMIADGEYPVPIDLETIFHHRVKSAAGGDGEINVRLRASVLSSDLLPDPVKVDHQYFDISALARSEEEEGEAEVILWKNINTDVMDYSCQRQRAQPGQNLPKLNGNVAALNDYTKLILGGFEEAYRFLQGIARELLDENGLLRSMFAHDARFIFRSTALYSLILRRALHPAYLRDGVDFGSQLDALARKSLNAADKPLTWALLRAETASLWQLDIPKFTARGDENALSTGPGKLIAGCFADSAWNAARAKIEGLWRRTCDGSLP